jgi:UrcA family protein
MEQSMMKTLLIAAGATAALLASPVVSASELQTRHVAVGYADLNLDRQAGAEAMLDRIERAARRACDSEGANWIATGRQTQALRECAREAAYRAVVELDAPLVTALHDAKSPSAPTSAAD